MIVAIAPVFMTEFQLIQMNYIGMGALIALGLVLLTGVAGVTTKDLYHLFPKAPARTIARIAGFALRACSMQRATSASGRLIQYW